jgi:hypothetical protein
MTILHNAPIANQTEFFARHTVASLANVLVFMLVAFKLRHKYSGHFECLHLFINYKQNWHHKPFHQIGLIWLPNSNSYYYIQFSWIIVLQKKRTRYKRLLSNNPSNPWLIREWWLTSTSCVKYSTWCGAYFFSLNQRKIVMIMSRQSDRKWCLQASRQFRSFLCDLLLQFCHDPHVNWVLFFKLQFIRCPVFSCWWPQVPHSTIVVLPHYSWLRWIIYWHLIRHFAHGNTFSILLI